jgi:uncharacterized membrane protein
VKRPVRRALVLVHIIASIGWIGSVATYIALGVLAAANADDLIKRSAWIAMEFTGWYVIVPLAVLSLATGIITSTSGGWGLLRHYWVAISLTLTVFCVAILLLHMPDVTTAANRARDTTRPAHQLGSDLFHPTVGLAILLFIATLNTYKPKGLTRYGHHKAQERRTAP